MLRELAYLIFHHCRLGNNDYYYPMVFFVAFSELVEYDTCDRKAQAFSVANQQNGKHLASLNVRSFTCSGFTSWYPNSLTALLA